MAAHADIKLIVGLGNPGPRYEHTRHNAGFWLLDRLARDAGAGLRQESKFQGEFARADLHGRDVRLLKPTTFMNESGRSVKAVCNYYKISIDEVLVLHDEIDFPPGQVKIKKGGGHGGHNGLRSLINHVGKDFTRVRIGVGHPGDREQVVDAVLSRPGKKEQQLIDESLDRCERAIGTLLSSTLEKAMHELHSKPRKAKEPAPPAKKESSGSEAPKPAAERPKPSEPEAEPESDNRQRAGLKEQLKGWFRRDES